MEININIIDELSMIFFWIGLSGVTEKLIDHSYVKHSKLYIYTIILLIGIYLKI